MCMYTCVCIHIYVCVCVHCHPFFDSCTMLYLLYFISVLELWDIWKRSAMMLSWTFEQEKSVANLELISLRLYAIILQAQLQKLPQLAFCGAGRGLTRRRSRGGLSEPLRRWEYFGTLGQRATESIEILENSAVVRRGLWLTKIQRPFCATVTNACRWPSLYTHLLWLLNRRQRLLGCS